MLCSSDLSSRIPWDQTASVFKGGKVNNFLRDYQTWLTEFSATHAKSPKARILWMQACFIVM